MNKILLASLILACISYSIEVETEIKVGANATWGADGIAYPYSHLSNMLRISLPRENTFDEKWPEIPDFTPNDNGNNNSGSSNNAGNTETGANTAQPSKPIYVDSQTEKDILLSKRYLSRGIQFDKTLLDANVKIKDYGTKFGVVVKGRPNRYDQGWSLFDVNRAYFTLDVDTDPVKLNSVLYLKGYEKGTPGLNRFSEEGYRDPKKHGQLDVKASITPFKFIITPDVDLEYKGTLKEHFDYKLKPGFKLNIYEDDNNEISVSTKMQILKNNNEDVVNYLSDDIAFLSPGNREIEYFKNWEIGKLILDETYNKDKTILGKDGKAAYRYIGQRDPKLGHLSGLNGSIRSIGTPTGSLYGESFFEKATKAVLNKAIDNLEKDSTLSSLTNDLRDEVKQGGFGFFGKSIFIGKYVFKTEKLKNEVNKILENKNGEYDKIVEPIINEIFAMTKIDNKGNLSDFNAIHYIPREYRSWLGNTLPEIPYEDSIANKEKRKNEAPEREVIVGKDPSKTQVNPGIPGNSGENPIDSKPTVYPEDTNKTEVLGSNKENKGKTYVAQDSRRSIFASELKNPLDNLATLIKSASGNKNWFNLIFKGNDLFNNLFYNSNGKSLMSKMLYNSEELSSFDMFSSLQISESESDKRSREYKEYLGGYLATIKNANNKLEGYKVTENKPSILTGYDFSINYKNKKVPLSIKFNALWNGSERTSEIVTDYTLNKSDKSLRDIGKDSYLEYLVTTKKIAERDQVKYEFKGMANTKETTSHHNLDFGLKYDDNKLKVETSINTDINHIHFSSSEDEIMKYTYEKHSFWSTSSKTESMEMVHKLNASYTNYIFKPSLNLSYIAEPNKYFELVPKLLYEGKFEYKQYEKIEGAEYLKSDEGKDNSKLTELKIDVFKRDENNKLIKAQNAPKTGNEEFDKLEAGSSVDISKYSKFIFTDIEKTFEKEKQVGKSRWKDPVNIFVPALDVYYKPLDFVKLGYHFLMPVVLKGKNIDGFFIRNGLSVTVHF